MCEEAPPHTVYTECVSTAGQSHTMGTLGAAEAAAVYFVNGQCLPEQVTAGFTPPPRGWVGAATK